MDSDSYARFVAEFMDESDRAAIVLGAAQIDDLLAQILEKRLIGNTKKLFDFNGPIGTFSSRINIACATGVIDKEFGDAIHLIRDLRNTCAHSILTMDLSSQPNTSKIQQLCQIYSGTAYWASSTQSAAAAFGKSGSPLFLRVALAHTIANLSMILIAVAQIDSSSAHPRLVIK